MNQITQSLAVLLITSQYVHVNSAFVPHCSSPSRQPASSLLMSKGKDNHRARLEKNLEDMMDRDWRLFRAKLVANEEADAKSTTRDTRQNRHAEVALDERQVKQEKFSNIFAAIFNSSKQHDESSIFDGDAIGGATANSMIPESCEDPFVSKAEIPVLLQPKVHIDKHRWAHPLTHIETGCVLVANEKLGGVFHQTVVLVIEHNDVTGSTGIVINRPLAGTLNKVASETKSNVDLSLKLAFNASPVTYGGPVMQEEYSILHGYGEVEGSKKIVPGIFVGGSEKLMAEIRKNNLEADEALFVKGHAAWVPNQLSREVSKGVWYPASVSSDFILRYAGAPVAEDDNKVDLWADILTALGDNYAEIAVGHSKKGDRRMMP
mmetsp:Transcript_6328/g.9314  ORF Transcript_6328/g.9314 Transcript_6328/m.9314 type:complete len:377 (-) Transcript_6328:193-1323(-)|eukprot:CAMPEP_0197232730 /NCGR_PEP_ID=MMETSP1429-20130617/971_1 /TAXON_ID=49237 /ORGANISM="Chaetoceros  sp., Strain UNC1202" /LENGTH=376 /DNA_ID=CAMNT_0042690849 /DNA_START=131 /DNA_END=1261 /DNA_ORIENTATION=-